MSKNKEPLKTKTGATSEEGKLQEQLENEAYKLEYVNRERDGRMRDETLESNLRVAYNIIFSNFCDKELQNRLEHKVDFTSKI